MAQSTSCVAPDDDNPFFPTWYRYSGQAVSREPAFRTVKPDRPTVSCGVAPTRIRLPMKLM